MRVGSSPALEAAASAWGSEPRPLSFVFVTAMVSACVQITAVLTRAQEIPAPKIEKLRRDIVWYFTARKVLLLKPRPRCRDFPQIYTVGATTLFWNRPSKLRKLNSD